jgi:hypothetical protein
MKLFSEETRIRFATVAYVHILLLLIIDVAIKQGHQLASFSYLFCELGDPLLSARLIETTMFKSVDIL